MRRCLTIYPSLPESTKSIAAVPSRRSDSSPSRRYRARLAALPKSGSPGQSAGSFACGSSLGARWPELQSCSLVVPGNSSGCELSKRAQYRRIAMSGPSGEHPTLRGTLRYRKYARRWRGHSRRDIFLMAAGSYGHGRRRRMFRSNFCRRLAQGAVFLLFVAAAGLGFRSRAGRFSDFFTNLATAARYPSSASARSSDARGHFARGLWALPRQQRFAFLPSGHPR